jgi:hypothetical protein
MNNLQIKKEGKVSRPRKREVLSYRYDSENHRSHLVLRFNMNSRLKFQLSQLTFVQNTVGFLQSKRSPSAVAYCSGVASGYPPISEDVANL